MRHNPFTDNIDGLLPNTMYHYRVKGRQYTSSAYPYQYSEDLTFSTLADSIPPIISVISISKIRISNKVGYTRCTVTFKANEDILEWELRAGGEGPGQGTLVESGGSLSAGTTVDAYIDYNELPYEAEWRINIYAKDKAGNWTPYDDSR